MDTLARVAAVRQWSRGGIRAPHKPLLILYGIGRLLQTGSSRITFAEAEEPLRRLLLAYGPPGVGATPQYPFRRLEHDGLWRVTTLDGSPDPGERVADLRRSAVGEFSPDFIQALADPTTRTAVIERILEENFPPSIHDDLLADVGIDTERLLGISHPARPGPARDPRFRDLVLTAYEYRCAFCGFDGCLGPATIGLDAAHVRWHALEGPDTLDNGLGLCTIHHKLFDKGALGLADDHAILVSQEFVGRGEAAQRLVVGLAGTPMIGPRTGAPPPAKDHIDWHRSQVFRGPPRAA